MSKIICECGEMISSYADAYPKCGFPMAKYLREHNMEDDSKMWVCPTCGRLAKSLHMINCDFCSTIMVLTDIDYEKYDKEDSKIIYEQLCNKPYKELTSEEDNECYFKEQKRIALEYGTGFNQELYEERVAHSLAESYGRLPSNSKLLTQPSNQPHCPTCGSTNIKKIGTGERAASILGFGLFSKKVGKQWHCNNCGSNF